MKSRLIAFFKENKKKVITFVIAGIFAACGVMTDAGVIEHSVSVLFGW